MVWQVWWRVFHARTGAGAGDEHFPGWGGCGWGYCWGMYCCFEGSALPFKGSRWLHQRIAHWSVFALPLILTPLLRALNRHLQGLPQTHHTCKSNMFLSQPQPLQCFTCIKMQAGMTMQLQVQLRHQPTSGSTTDLALSRDEEGVMALLFPSHVFCSVFVGVRTGCLNHKSPTIWLVTCSAWAPLYGWSQVLSELRYMVVTDIGSAELSLSQEYLVWEWINRQGIDY